MPPAVVTAPEGPGLHSASRAVQPVPTYRCLTSLVGAILGLVAFGISGYAFVTADKRVDEVLLFGLPTPSPHSIPLGPRWLVELSWDATALGSPGVVAVVLVCVSGYLWCIGRSAPATYLLASVVSGGAFGYVVKRAFGLARPHGFPALGTESATSFPSGHALLGALLLTSLAMVAVRCAPKEKQARTAAVSFGAAVLISGAIGLSRVHLRLHWPTDVAAGWVLGAGWAILFGLSSRPRKGSSEREQV